jgi:hypothetical protein
MVTLQLKLPASVSYCDQGCGGTSTHITILTVDKQPIATDVPFCSTTCASCQPVACPAGGACAVYGAALTGAELQWDGNSYPMATCGAGVSCYQPTFVPAGQYVAHMCATPGKLATPANGQPVCTATGAQECVDVVFTLPGSGVVEGTLTGGTAGAVPCENPQPIPVSNGVASVTGDTGFDRCADGAIRRRAVVTCPLGPAAATSPCGALDGQCASDADCTAQPHGLCANSHKLLGYCGCFYGCMKDADCGAGSVCFCGDPVGSCVPATCVSASSCASGFACASSSSGCGGGMGSFACQVATDECLGDTDCGANARCVLQSGRRVCTPDCLLPPAP